MIFYKNKKVFFKLKKKNRKKKKNTIITETLFLSIQINLVPKYYANLI